MVCIELCNEVDAKHKHTSVSDDVLANRWREEEERKKRGMEMSEQTKIGRSPTSRIGNQVGQTPRTCMNIKTLEVVFRYFYSIIPLIPY